MRKACFPTAGLRALVTLSSFRQSITMLEHIGRMGTVLMCLYTVSIETLFYSYVLSENFVLLSEPLLLCFILYPLYFFLVLTINLMVLLFLQYYGTLGVRVRLAFGRFYFIWQLFQVPFCEVIYLLVIYINTVPRIQLSFYCTVYNIVGTLLIISIK